MTDEVDAIDHLFAGCPPTIGPNDVSTRLGVSIKSVYKYLKEGLIPGYQLGTTWFVITEELKQTLRKGANKRPSTGPVIVIKPEAIEGE